MIGCSGRVQHNRACESALPSGFLSGQRVGILAQMRYGLCSMGWNGCECIAVYNTLIYLGRTPSLADVVQRLERFRMLFGILGCNPLRLGTVLTNYGIRFSVCSHLPADGAFILSYWTGKRFLSSLHTVLCVRSGERITVYNRYSRSASEYICTAEELLNGHRLIIAYHIIK